MIAAESGGRCVNVLNVLIGARANAIGKVILNYMTRPRHALMMISAKPVSHRAHYLGPKRSLQLTRHRPLLALPCLSPCYAMCVCVYIYVNLSHCFAAFRPPEPSSLRFISWNYKLRFNGEGIPTANVLRLKEI